MIHKKRVYSISKIESQKTQVGTMYSCILFCEITYHSGFIKKVRLGDVTANCKFDLKRGLKKLKSMYIRELKEMGLL